MEVVPRVSPNCTEEIPVTWNNTSVFVDPISYIIKSAASPTGATILHHSGGI
jgi:hypothetical protein